MGRNLFLPPFLILFFLISCLLLDKSFLETLLSFCWFRNQTLFSYNFSHYPTCLKCLLNYKLASSSILFLSTRIYACLNHELNTTVPPEFYDYLDLFHPKSFLTVNSYTLKIFYEIISFQMNFCFICDASKLSLLALEFVCFEISVGRLTLRKRRRIFPFPSHFLCLLSQCNDFGVVSSWLPRSLAQSQFLEWNFVLLSHGFIRYMKELITVAAEGPATYLSYHSQAEAA